jgi:hypothetical protein
LLWARYAFVFCVRDAKPQVAVKIGRENGRERAMD